MVHRFAPRSQGGFRTVRCSSHSDIRHHRRHQVRPLTAGRVHRRAHRSHRTPYTTPLITRTPAPNAHCPSRVSPTG